MYLFLYWPTTWPNLRTVLRVLRAVCWMLAISNCLLAFTPPWMTPANHPVGLALVQVLGSAILAAAIFGLTRAIHPSTSAKDRAQ
jgi:hypothetical protein